MQVIGSGFGRTGTLSLKTALEILGFYRCYHMMEVPRNLRHPKVWEEASRGENVDWEKLFVGYEASVDFPASVYYKEMMEAFPHAKVLHSVRDPQGWYESTLDTIYQGDKFPAWVGSWIPFAGSIFKAMDRKVWKGLFAGRFEEREHAIKVFEEYTAEVKRSVPAERLLVFSVKQGWEPLCEFLGVPVPDVPFPHRNDRAAMKRVFALLHAARWALQIGALGLLGWGLWRLLG